MSPARGTAAEFERALASEQLHRYRRNLGNLLATDYLRLVLYRNGGDRVDITPLESPAGLSGVLKSTANPAEQLDQLLMGMGVGFRPLEHFLDDRRGRRQDIEQIEMFCCAAFAVPESLELAEPLDEAIASVLEDGWSLPDAADAGTAHGRSTGQMLRVTDLTSPPRFAQRTYVRQAAHLSSTWPESAGKMRSTPR